MIRVTVWNEFVHENEHDSVRRIYPDGIHVTVADALTELLGEKVTVRTATLREPEHGLPQSVLDETDVLTWWGHAAHDQVRDDVVDRIHRRVLGGMGLIAMHSAHASKIFVKLMGTTCMLRWREAGEKERLWVVDPSHPIVSGIEEEFIELPSTEMYGEHFDIPAPDELVMISWFEGGEVFRSCCTFRRGKGKVVYFRPGHETYPIYRDSNVRRILANSVMWAAPSGGHYIGNGRNISEPLSPIKNATAAHNELHKQ